MEIKEYAPVVIPTLCRYKHFKECLESLMRCRHAENTDVYIGLDYPANEEHWDGYKKIDEYLESIKKHHKFKNLIVIRREKNYGLGKNGNANQLVKYISEKYDRWIFSEDDNVFSVAFLDYMNKGLELFKNDKSVYAICGYKHFLDLKFDNNTFIRQNVDMNAWGYGIWKDRYVYNTFLTPFWFKKKFSLKSFNQIRKKNGNDRAYHFYMFKNEKPNTFCITDIVMSVFIFLYNLDVITPYISHVRNMGMDGSGASFKDIKQGISIKYEKQSIYQEASFDYIGSGLENYEHNRSVYKHHGYGNFSIFKLGYYIIKDYIRNVFNYKIR